MFRESSNGPMEMVMRPSLDTTECALEYRPVQFDRIELWRVWRQEQRVQSGGRDGRENCRVFVHAQIVHDDDVTWSRVGQQVVTKPMEELDGVDRAVVSAHRDDSCQSNGADDAHVLAAIHGSARSGSLADRCACIARRHGGIATRFVDEN